MGNSVTVFTKPWPGKSLEALADFLRASGVDGVELPVRPGFQVTPETASPDLGRASRIFRERGLAIRSVAAAASAAMIAACGDAGVPILRVMATVDMTQGYRVSVDAHRRSYDALLGDLERHGVAIGVQNHCDHFVGSAVGLMDLIRGYDPRLVGAVLDPAHCALDGEPEEMAVDIAWPSLILVNLKNVYWQRVTTDACEPDWRKYWCTGRHGLCSWPTVVRELGNRGWAGDYCLTAEYSSPEASGDLKDDAALPLFRDDVRYLRSLLA